VIGPRDHLIAFFLINALQQGRLFYIGDGNQKISLSDGRDVAHCLLLAGQSSKVHGQAYNVKSFDSTPRLLIEAFAERLNFPAPEKHRSYFITYILSGIVEGIWMFQGKKPPITRHKVKVMGTPRTIDITKAIQELNYTPRYNFTTTINDVVIWYQTLTAGSSRGK
jgi:nucleoside-diphosphate-sugar epimerase